ncbi:thioredoxin fold domain-containing protein [Candidatus Thiodubiliella endoseptemdiera]|uniref:Thioredoxin fold domain-containing protein n=1 Tax=Candidatus Thiodubiliella endoseptemdiera TaxID=2738886 RepID=A0A853F0I6_9GAMM|nr:thioredoxin fold domain-containing protein [Candidatus Thiodubiliella endoseptemdiera]
MRNFNLKFVIVFLMLIGMVSVPTLAKEGKIVGGVIYSMPSWFKESFLELVDDVDEAKQKDKHVLLFFHLDECPYCDHMAKNFDKPFLRDFVQEHFDVIAINMRGDKEVALGEDKAITEKEFSIKVGVRYTPTIVFLNQKNKIVARTNGYRSPEKFIEVLGYVQSKSYKNSTLAEYIEVNKKTGNYQLQDHVMFQKVTDFSTIKTPLAVIFEDKNCDACAYFHNTTLKNKAVMNEFNAFSVARLDANSTQAIIDNKGNKTTPKAWVKKLKLNYRPGIILFNKGDEITRIDGFLYTFHFKEALRFVSGNFYQKLATYGAYLAYRQKELLEQGIDIDISK